MYIKKSRAYVKGKTYEYLRLVQGVRVGSKIKHRVVSYLGRIDDPNSAASFLFNKAPVKNKTQLARLYGLPMACNQIIEKILDLQSVLLSVFPASIPSDTYLLIKLMILSRILKPESKLSLTRWYHHLYLPETLPKKIDVHQFYSALDTLILHKEAIERNFLRQKPQ
jgi:hypothetical protein